MNTRGYAKSTQAEKAGTHAPSRYSKYISLPGPQVLLVHQLLNELLNSVRGINIETQVGMSEVALREMFDELDGWLDKNHECDSEGVIVISDVSGLPISSLERAYSADEIRSLRNTAELVMLDLGQEEFFTRTGFSLTEGKQLLDRLNAALLDPLHLDQPTQPIAH